MTMPRLAVFDLEISYTPALDNMSSGPGQGIDIWQYWPFGISIGATKRLDRPQSILWFNIKNGVPYQCMSLSSVNRLVDYLAGLHRSGYALVGWNSTGFDWRLLHKITGDGRCIQLCLDSFDPCFQALCLSGYPVGLNAVALANNLPTKELHGDSVPKLWFEGHHKQVVDYLRGDIIRTEGAVLSIMKRHGIRWVTKRGNIKTLRLDGFLTARECLELPPPPRCEEEGMKRRLETVKWLSLR